jgi:predicted ABC-type exoprotein transport system permease subunit
MLTSGIVEKRSSKLNLKTLRVLRDVHIVLIFLAFASIGAGIYQLIKAIPPQNPTFTTEYIPVVSILIFIAGGIAVFSGASGLKRQFSIKARESL